MFPAFSRLDDTAVAYLVYVRETHFRHGSIAVQTAFLFHLQNDVFQHFLFVLIQLQGIQDQLIAFNDLAGRKTQRQTGSGSVVIDQVNYRMNAAVNCSASGTVVTEVVIYRGFLVSGNVNGVVDQLINALITGSGDRYYRNSQHVFHHVDVDRTSVTGHFIHHVESHDHRNLHLQ